MAAGMIRPVDRFALPRGVRLEGDSLRDTAVGGSYPLGSPAPLCVGLLSAGHSVGEVARIVSSRYAASEEVVASDLAALVLTLNRAGLLNVVPAGGPVHRARRKVADLVVGLAVGIRPPALVQRYEVSAPSIVGMLRQVTTAVLLAHAWLWLGLGMVFVVLGLLSSPTALVALAALQVGLMSGLIVHEVGHVIAARWWSGGCFLLTSGIGGVRVMHRRAARRAWISATGPGLASASGAVVLASGCATGWPPLDLAALPLLGNLLGFTIIFGDGRSIVSGRWRAG